MAFLRHSILLWCYGALGVCIALFAPLLIPSLDWAASITLGAVVFVAAALVHETAARLSQSRRLMQDNEELRFAFERMQDEFTWLSREVVALRAKLDGSDHQANGPPPHGEEGRVDRVVAEVKILQSLIERLYRVRTHEEPSSAESFKPAQLAAAEHSEVSQEGVDLSSERHPSVVSSFDHVGLAADNSDDWSDGPNRLAEVVAERAEESDVERRSGPVSSVEPASTAPRQEGHLAPLLPYELSEDEILDLAREALRDDRIDLVLQPIVTLPQRKRRFFEAFSRLRTAEGFAVLPEQYIKLAEREGLVTTIDNMLLFRCVQLVRKIQRRGDELDFFCNISRRSWEDDEFFNDFIDFLRSNLRLSENLIFEFAQLDFERWGEKAVERLATLAGLGCRFSLDQVRHLSLDPAQLAAREIRFLKLTPEVFMQQIRSNAAVVRDFDRAGVTIIVDKVEDETTLREVLDYEVIYAQGFLFSEPRLAKPAA